MPQAHDKEHEDVRNAGGKRAADMLAAMGREPLSPPLYARQQRKRVEHVVAHPCAERDVPAAPEIAEGDREVRLAEVGSHLDAEQPSKAEHHVDTAREVRVLVNRIHQDSHDDNRSRHAGIDVVQDGIDGLQQHVRNGTFLHEAITDLEQGAARVRGIKRMPLVKLMRQCVETVDGTLYELREERDEQQVLREVSLGVVLAVVRVDDVADRLERVKRDAERQQDAGNPVVARNEVVKDRLRVLDVAEDAEVQKQHREQNEPFLADEPLLYGLLFVTRLSLLSSSLRLRVEVGERKARDPRARSRDADEDEILETRERIEGQRRHEQDDPLALAERAADSVIHRERDGEEYDESERIELQTKGLSKQTARTRGRMDIYRRRFYHMVRFCLQGHTSPA